MGGKFEGSWGWQIHANHTPVYNPRPWVLPRREAYHLAGHPSVRLVLPQIHGASSEGRGLRCGLKIIPLRINPCVAATRWNAAARHGHAVRTCALHGISIATIQHREIAPPILTKEFAMRKKPLVISGSFNPAMLILSSVLLSISYKS